MRHQLIRRTDATAWVTGLAFISANLGAIEIMGMSANVYLWGGIAMLVFAALFVLWARLRPIAVPAEEKQ